MALSRNLETVERSFNGDHSCLNRVETGALPQIPQRFQSRHLEAWWFVEIVVMTSLGVPKTISEFIKQQNRLDWHDDRADLLRSCRAGLAIQRSPGQADAGRAARGGGPFCVTTHRILMNLFVVPMVGFKILYGFVIVRLLRRALVWIKCHNQPVSGVGCSSDHRGFSLGRGSPLHDPGRDRIYGTVVTRRLRAMVIRDKATAPARLGRTALPNG